jgi:hypothetical protein
MIPRYPHLLTFILFRAYAVDELSLRQSGTFFSTCAAAGKQRGVGYPLGDAKRRNCVNPTYNNFATLEPPEALTQGDVTVVAGDKLYLAGLHSRYSWHRTCNYF